MERIDSTAARSFRARGWNAGRAEAELAAVRAPVDVKVAVAVALYEAARASRPGWPSDADRRADLEHHRVSIERMRRANGGGAR